MNTHISLSSLGFKGKQDTVHNKGIDGIIIKIGKIYIIDFNGKENIFISFITSQICFLAKKSNSKKVKFQETQICYEIIIFSILSIFVRNFIILFKVNGKK